MTATLRSARVLAVIAAICAALAFSGGVVRAADAGRVPMPQIPKAQGERCVAGTDEMRRNHMNLLTHARDAAVHLGERKADVQLQRCLTCHAVNGPDGKPVSYTSERHFCRTCHDYAAVAIDCFQCHSSVPDAAARGAGVTGGNAPVRLGYGRDKPR